MKSHFISIFLTNAVHAPFESDPRFAENYADSDKPKSAQAFATLIEGMDKSLDDMLDHFEKLGIAENTLVFSWETTDRMRRWEINTWLPVPSRFAEKKALTMKVECEFRSSLRGRSGLKKILSKRSCRLHRTKFNRRWHQSLTCSPPF